MSFERFQAVAPKVTTVLQQVGFTVPMNLASVALAQRVHTVELRNMLLDGALEPTDGGFKVYIYDSNQEYVAPLTSSIILEPRQRFTLAHEIAHTFFFDTRGDKP